MIHKKKKGGFFLQLRFKLRFFPPLNVIVVGGKKVNISGVSISHFTNSA